MYILQWICEWFKENCDGDWEHQFGIKIQTIDNPGWNVTIDVSDTILEKLEIDYQFVETDDENWYGIKMIDGKFNAFGDPTKLEFLLNKFKELVEQNTIHQALE